VYNGIFTKQGRRMKKIFLIVLIPTLFIQADISRQEERVLQDSKMPYIIQDETVQSATESQNELFPNEISQVPVDNTDNELVPMEDIFDIPDEDVKEEIRKPGQAIIEKPKTPKIIQTDYLQKKKPVKDTKTAKKTSQKSKRELEIERIRKELDIKGPTPKELKLKRIKEALDIKEPSAKTLRIDSIREELKIGYRKPKYESTLDRRVEDVKEGIDALSVDNALSSIKSTLGMSSKKKDTGFFITDSLSAFGDTIGMDIGMPDFFGFGGSKKKKSSGILDSIMGFGFLGDIRDTGTSMYKGAKYSGQSAELMSGMMYNSSKMYNTMFGVFDDSPFNIFQEEEEASMFDIFEHGNSVMDMFSN
jgi:hypothetical protein